MVLLLPCVDQGKSADLGTGRANPDVEGGDRRGGHGRASCSCCSSGIVPDGRRFLGRVAHASMRAESVSGCINHLVTTIHRISAASAAARMIVNPNSTYKKIPSPPGAAAPACVR